MYRPIPSWSLVEPPPAVEAAPDLLDHAVRTLETPLESVLNKKDLLRTSRRRLGVAHVYARAIDWTAMEWFWIEAGLEWQRRHDKASHRPAAERSARTIPVAVRRAVIKRDGYRCRYCRTRVVTSATLTKLERLLPAALPMWPAEMGHAEIAAHAAQCVMRLTWDHVEPYSIGGTSTEENVVVTCGTCNFNKGSCTIEELSLRNPFERDPVPDEQWDGLDGRLGSKPVGPRT